MPQMMPLNWLLLPALFSGIFIISTMMIFSFMIHKPEIKFSLSTHKMLTWSW